MSHLLEDAELGEGARHVQRYQLQGFLSGEGGGGPPAPPPPPPAGAGCWPRLLPGGDERLGPLHQDAVQLRGQVQLEAKTHPRKLLAVINMHGYTVIFTKIYGEDIRLPIRSLPGLWSVYYLDPSPEICPNLDSESRRKSIQK